MSSNFNDKFCSACGNGLIHSAVVCPRCGSPVAAAGRYQQSPAKSKRVAVVLAVFFAQWSWLYTYRDNKVKFWVTLPLELIYIGAVLLQLLYSLTCTSYYCTGSGGFSIVQFLIGFPLWLWAVIDNSRKPRQYYEQYSRSLYQNT